MFAESTGKADFYCSNLTFVLQNQVREQRANTKADIFLQKQAARSQQKSKVATQTLDNDLPDSQRSLYRMTIDFRQINSVTLNQKTSQLPKVWKLIFRMPM